MKDARQYILERIAINPGTKCWEWQRSKTKRGYGYARIDNNLWLGHRLSYATFVGEISEGMYVCHECDNPSCVNPDHLWLGTQKQNLDDMKSKNRDHRRGKAKLTEQDVIKILEDLLVGKSRNALAKTYGVTPEQISKIKCGTNWSHVPRPEGWKFTTSNKRKRRCSI